VFWFLQQVYVVPCCLFYLYLKSVCQLYKMPRLCCPYCSCVCVKYLNLYHSPQRFHNSYSQTRVQFWYYRFTSQSTPGFDIFILLEVLRPNSYIFARTVWYCGMCLLSFVVVFCLLLSFGSSHSFTLAGTVADGVPSCTCLPIRREAA